MPFPELANTSPIVFTSLFVVLIRSIRVILPPSDE